MTASPIDYPFLRRIRIEFTGPNHTAGGDWFESDGTQNTLRISAVVNKRNIIAGDPTQIRIWNLSPDTRSNLRRSAAGRNDGTKIRILAGWDTGPRTELFQVFYGDFFNAITQKHSADEITTLYAQSSLENLTKAAASVSFDENELVSNAVILLAQKIEGVTVDRTRIIGLDYRLGTKWPNCDMVVTLIEMLSKEYGFFWTINDGIFTAVKGDGSILVDTVLEPPYLIQAQPKLSGVQQYETMVQWTSTFAPSLRPLSWVQINSDLMKKSLNGPYKIISLSHILDTYDANGFITKGIGYLRPGVYD